MKEYVSWTPRLTTHVDTIDEQHKELYQRLNSVVDAIMQGKGKEEVEQFINFLLEYTRFHFGTEERYMEQFQYPGILTHKTDHERLTREVQTMAEQLRSRGADSMLVVSVTQQMGQWLGDHIGTIDTALGRYLKTRL
ncbi:MAG: bacteriohemerythrin [Desulfomonile sp.]|nr:bacteriohemerythrin [Desulfomonile sp.]